MAEVLDPSVVKPSRHSLYMRGFHAGVRPEDVRRHFADRGYACTIVFFATVRGALNVALRFDSHDTAKRLLHKYNDGQTLLLGSRVSIVWFRDMQAARERVRNDPELRRMLEQRGAFRPSGHWRGGGAGAGGGGGGSSGGGGWQRRGRGSSFGDDDYHQYYDDAPASSSRSSRSRSRSVVSGDSRPKRYQQPPPAPSHRPESPPSPSPSHRAEVSPSRSRSQSHSRSRSHSPRVRSLSERRRSRSSPSPSASAPAPAAAAATATAPGASQAPTAGQLVRRRKAEIEAAYRQDCETFATVVKMLLRHDPGLDGPIQAALKASLRDIGDQSVAELRQFIDGLRRGTDAVSGSGDT